MASSHKIRNTDKSASFACSTFSKLKALHNACKKRDEPRVCEYVAGMCECTNCSDLAQGRVGVMHDRAANPRRQGCLGTCRRGMLAFLWHIRFQQRNNVLSKLRGLHFAQRRVARGLRDGLGILWFAAEVLSTEHDRKYLQHGYKRLAENRVRAAVACKAYKEI